MHRPALRTATAVAVGALLAGGSVAASAGAAPPPAAPAAAPVLATAPGDAAPTDRIIVRYRADRPGAAPGAPVQSQRRDAVQAAARAAAPGARAATVAHVRSTALGSQVFDLGVALPEAEVEAIAAQLVAQDPEIEYAEPDRVLRPLAAPPDDPRWADQWALQTTSVGIDVLTAWDVTQGAGVNVAVLDTGYRPHTDLAANVVGGYDMIGDLAVANDGSGRDADASDPGDWTAAGQCDPRDPAYPSSWHGTHVAGTISAVTGNGAGVAGVAPATKVVPLRVLGTCGGYTSDIADAMIWASGGAVSGVPSNADRARVLNLSLGGSGSCDTTSQRAIDTARTNGAVVVVAAGNANADVSTTSPANCSGVVAVAAYGPTGARAYYSNYGSLVDLAAPGGDQSGGSTRGILSTLNSGTSTPGSDSYAYYQGTSMATPHVAAVAALMLSANPTLTPDQVETLLKSSAQPFVATCSGCGAGMLDANAAVRAATGGTTPEPEPEPTTAAEVEPNDSRSSANRVAVPVTVAGAMGSTQDTDWFSVSLPAGSTLTATLTAGSTSADYDLYLYNAKGRLVARSDFGAGRTDSASVTNGTSRAATYYARVVHYSGGTGTTSGAYRLGLAW